MTIKEAIPILKEMKGGGSEWDQALDIAAEELTFCSNLYRMLDYIDGVGDFWQDQMPMMTMEEMGELTQAISKLERYLKRYQRDGYSPEEYLKKREHVAAEMADVLISIGGLVHYYDINPKLIIDRIDAKLDVKY